MKDIRSFHEISSIPASSWGAELEQRSSKYHVTAVWVAIVFNPLFAVTDYFNIPQSWELLLTIRLMVSFITLATLIAKRNFRLPSYVLVAVPFFLISLQNAYTYSLIGNADLVGQNLNYIALLMGAALFVLWRWTYSVMMVIVSVLVTAFFVRSNAALNKDLFFVDGGLLLCAMAVFMVILIQSRYTLTVKEIKARLALHASKEEILAQAEEISGINENLELLVKERTRDLERKNKALEEYAFINAHKLRSPVASILGLINLMNKIELNEEASVIKDHLRNSTQKLDSVVSSITKVIEKGEN